MWRQNSRLFISCVVLALSTLWGVYGSGQSRVNEVGSQKSPTLISQSVTNEISNNIGEVSPMPQPEPLTKPVVKSWQGEVQPIAIPPAPHAPVLTRIPTDQPVVFLGIDDGMVKSQEAKEWLLEHRMPFTLFLDNHSIQGNYEYFLDLQDGGMTIQNHTLSHRDLAELSIEEQKAEICGAADHYHVVFGNRPTLLRPPYGSYNDLTREAAVACGMKALINWSAKANGGSIQFQYSNNSFLPGDIILMHFREEFLQDMKAFTDQLERDGLHVGRLEDWIN